MNGQDLTDDAGQKFTLSVSEYQPPKGGQASIKQFNNLFVKGFGHVEDFNEADLKELFE